MQIAVKLKATISGGSSFNFVITSVALYPLLLKIPTTSSILYSKQQPIVIEGGQKLHGF